MTLTEKLKEHANGSAKRLPLESQNIMKSAIDQLVTSSILDNALKTGDTIPTISLSNHLGETIDVKDILLKNRLVLTFYRGGWCPYCNLELKALQSVLPEMEAKGAKLIAISPELPDNSMTTVEKNQLSFQVLSDINNKVAEAFNLVFTLPPDLQEIYRGFNIDLDTNQGNTQQQLPIAATYIIEQDGSISYDYLAEDYKLRADPQDILKAL